MLPNEGQSLFSEQQIRGISTADLQNDDKDLQKGDLYTFRERRCRANLKRNKEEREFWTKADPTIDAWMLVTGRKREVFDVSSFVQQHRDILPELKQVRNVVSVLILPSRCPVTKALNDLEPEIPSQSYWTTLKSWRPW